MSISARLSRILHRTLGDQGADDLVNWMTKVESGRSELAELMSVWRVATDAKFAVIDTRFDGVDRRLESLDRRLAALEARMADLFRWSFVFWIGTMATTVGAMIAIARFMR
jgi:hypothetical protein